MDNEKNTATELKESLFSQKKHAAQRMSAADTAECNAFCDKYIAQAAPVRNGRIELTHYIKEQSISNEYHRYGSQIEVPKIED